MSITVFDLDGVLSDSSRRDKLLRAPGVDLDDPTVWQAYHDDMANDPPLAPGIELWNSFDHHHNFVVTSRGERWRKDTRKWAATYLPMLSPARLIMRPEGAPWSTWKADEIYALHGEYGVRLIVEDDPYWAGLHAESMPDVPVLLLHSEHYAAVGLKRGGASACT